MNDVHYNHFAQNILSCNSSISIRAAYNTLRISLQLKCPSARRSRVGGPQESSLYTHVIVVCITSVSACLLLLLSFCSRGTSALRLDGLKAAPNEPKVSGMHLRGRRANCCCCRRLSPSLSLYGLLNNSCEPEHRCSAILVRGCKSVCTCVCASVCIGG